MALNDHVSKPLIVDHLEKSKTSASKVEHHCTPNINCDISKQLDPVVTPATYVSISGKHAVKCDTHLLVKV